MKYVLAAVRIYDAIMMQITEEVLMNSVSYTRNSNSEITVAKQPMRTVYLRGVTFALST